MRRSNIITRLKKWLDKERFEHSLRVEKTALRLAKHYKSDKEKAMIAALLHDCGRHVKSDELTYEALKFGIKINDIERFQPKLLHAKLGKAVAKRVFKIKDSEILSAIEKHTVGSENMTLLEKIIYLADHIESRRRYHRVARVRKLAFVDPDQAIVESTSSMLRDLLKFNLPISEQTVKTRNYYLVKRNAG